MSDQLRALYERVTTWQRKTFPNQTAASILAHMRLELKEIEAAPHDIEERADMAILAMGHADRVGDGLQGRRPAEWGTGMRSESIDRLQSQIEAAEKPGGRICAITAIHTCAMGTRLSYHQFLDAISAKMDKNEARRWPTPDQQIPGKPVEHIRYGMDNEVTLAELTPALVTNEIYILRASVAALEAERAEWRADNERLRAERCKIRTWLQAQPHEGPLEAVARLCHEIVALRDGGER